MENAENQTLEYKTNEIVNWMDLTGTPTAATIDPNNKIGLAGAFKKYSGAYLDPIPQEVLEKAIKGTKRVEIPLLESQTIGETVIKEGSKTVVFIQGKRIYYPRITTGGKFVPLFREQIHSAAQFLVKLGFEPEPKKGGESFVWGGQEEIQTYPTKNPHIKVKVKRSGTNENSPVTSVKLVVNS